LILITSSVFLTLLFNSDGYHQKKAAGDMAMSGAAYFTYMDRQYDDSPLYLFDKTISERVPELAADFTVPAVFPEDLLGLLDGHACRPDHRYASV
jgi:hypothetical protein